MFGLLGARGAQFVDGTPPEPPSLEMLADPGFDDPSKWTSAGGSTVTGSQLISQDDSGAAPTFGALRPEAGDFDAGSTYRLLSTVGVLPGGSVFRILLYSVGGTQLIGEYSSSAPIDQTFVADNTYTAVQVSFFELGIRLNDLSVELVPP